MANSIKMVLPIVSLIKMMPTVWEAILEDLVRLCMMMVWLTHPHCFWKPLSHKKFTEAEFYDYMPFLTPICSRSITVGCFNLTTISSLTIKHLIQSWKLDLFLWTNSRVYTISYLVTGQTFFKLFSSCFKVIRLAGLLR